MSIFTYFTSQTNHTVIKISHKGALQALSWVLRSLCSCDCIWSDCFFHPLPPKNIFCIRPCFSLKNYTTYIFKKVFLYGFMNKWTNTYVVQTVISKTFFRFKLCLQAYIVFDSSNQLNISQGKVGWARIAWVSLNEF